MLVSSSCLWTVSPSIAWNKIFRETENLVSEGESLRQADRNVEKLYKDAYRVGGPVYIRRVNRLSRSLEAQKSLAQGDVAQAQRIVRMAGSDILPSVRMAVQQAQKQKLRQPSGSQEKPVVYERPIIVQEQEREHKYEGKQREPKPISLPVQKLAALEESHSPELMRAQRREKINQLVQNICVEDVGIIESLSAEGSAGEEEPTAEDIKSLTDDVQQDIAEFHTTLKATHEELPELDNFVRDAKSKAQACEVRVKAGLSKISAPQPQAQPAVAEPKVEKAKKQPKRVTFAPQDKLVTFAPEHELEKVKTIDEPEEEEAAIPSKTEGSEGEELTLLEALMLVQQPGAEPTPAAVTIDEILQRYLNDLISSRDRLNTLEKSVLQAQSLDEKKYEEVIAQFDAMRFELGTMQKAVLVIDRPKTVESIKNQINTLLSAIDQADMRITERYVLTKLNENPTVVEYAQRILKVARERNADAVAQARLHRYSAIMNVEQLKEALVNPSFVQ
jgi:hypothetical protein